MSNGTLLADARSAGKRMRVDEASLALGATPAQTAIRVTPPYACPGILSALVLSIGRAFAAADLVVLVGLTNVLPSRFARFGGAEGTRTKKATR